MRPFFYLIFAFFSFASIINAQEKDYLPLVREGVRWHYGYYDNVDNMNSLNWTCFYEFKGDSIINGNVYKKLYRTITNGAVEDPEAEEQYRFPFPVEETTTFECCMIEKDKIVYAMYENGNDEDLLPMWLYDGGCDPEAFAGELGMRLYDFNQPLELKTGQYNIQGVKCNKYHINFKFWNPKEYGLEMDLIEGFGYTLRNSGYESTLAQPYMPACTCSKGWYFVKFTDTEDNVLFDPEKPLVNGVDGVKVAEVKGDGRYYNLQGQAVDIKTAPAGIYIHNGKKVVVK